MFDLLFGWRKASKCKKLIKRVQCRLRLLKNKRQTIVRQLREDVANLIKIGRSDIALTRAEHLHKDSCLVAAYDLLDNFCEFILIQLPYIRKHKDCPNDVKEAVSSLIFASARCGDLPELRKIRKLFGERYGKSFEMTALELMPGNLVNLQVKEKLSSHSVPVDVKTSLVDEIASDYCLRPVTLMLEYADKDTQRSDGRAEDSRVTEALRTNKREGKAVYLDPASACLSSNLQSPVDLKREEIPSPKSYASHHFTHDSLEFSLHNKTEKLQDLSGPNSVERCTNEVPTNATIPRYREDRYSYTNASSSPPFQEEAIEYLDDIDEVQSSTAAEGICQDQRIFKFKSCSVPKSGKIKDTCHVLTEDHDESSARLCNGGKRVKISRKRSRARFATQHVLYFERSCRRCPSYRNRSHIQIKYLKKYLIVTSKLMAERRRRQPPHSCHCFDLGAEHFCLKQPCYFCMYDCLLNHEIPTGKKSKEISTLHWSMNEESDSVMERFFFAHRPRRRSCESDPLQHDPTSTLTSKITKPPYLRAMTMPQERIKEDLGGNVTRTRSFPVETPGHVHPKLPDYDAIAAQFMALKKEHATEQRRWKPISF